MKNITHVFALLGLVCSTALAAPATQSAPHPLTVAYVEDFLKESGLQACRVEKLNPSVSSWHGTITSMWVEIAPDCTKSDSNNPDVVHVHQFSNTNDRDSMVSRYRSSMPRGISLRAGIWPVGDFSAVALIGPNTGKYRAQLQATYEKRLAAARKK
jgi:hypothetical protein